MTKEVAAWKIEQLMEGQFGLWTEAIEAMKLGYGERNNFTYRLNRIYKKFLADVDVHLIKIDLGVLRNDLGDF